MRCLPTTSRPLQKQRQELEAKITDRQAALSRMLTQARRLRDSRCALLGRIKSATAAPPPAPPPRPPRPPPTCATLIRSTADRHSIFATQLIPPRHPSAFRHLCPVSYAEVAHHMTAGPPRSDSDPHGVMDALQSFLRATAARYACHPADICFFIQLPFDVTVPAAATSASPPCPTPATLPLSHSAGITSAPCCLSMTVSFLALTIEATFLVREHVALLQASTSAGPPRETAAPEDVGPSEVFTQALPPVAPMPAAASCRHLVLRCGVGETCPLLDAIADLLPPLLRRYRSSLPHPAWRRVCLQAVHVVQGTLDSMGADAAAAGGDGSSTDGGATGSESAGETCMHACPGAEAQAEAGGEGDVHEGGAGEMCWAELDVAMKIGMEAMLHHLTAALHAPQPQVCLLWPLRMHACLTMRGPASYAVPPRWYELEYRG